MMAHSGIAAAYKISQIRWKEKGMVQCAVVFERDICVHTHRQYTKSEPMVWLMNKAQIVAKRK